MKLGDIITFRKDLYFEGAVQADWFYMPEKASKVAENFVFHGKDYFGTEQNNKVKTIDTISLLQTIAKKLIDESANPLSMAIADYGTGKSHLAVTIAQLFSGASYMPDTFSTVISNIKKIDVNAANEISDLCMDKNFVLVINGMRDFNLHYEILRAAQKSLKLYGLKDDNLRNLNRAAETAGLFFDRNCGPQRELFESSAIEHGWRESGNELITKIKENLIVDDTAFSIVNSVYKQVTGKDISWDEGISARAILDMLLTEYCGLNGQFDHIIILFDEFGRYLEYASGSDAGKSGDSALQQMFEAAQDSDGALQIINFIQSDIKTYLVRVDQTRNISRYIGRYDQSDKYYISSNLETVFANLIYRKNKKSFSNIIVSWQTEHDAEWRYIYDQMNRWLTLSGIWGDYALFRKVIVEGIYPMHPLSTFMLTQLSDYLQNRSSMTMISQYISNVAHVDTADGIPIVLPTELMEGDLYQELLSSEINGKQLSQHCIRYDNILRKHGDKLSDRSLSVLRANLIARLLRFKTRDYEDAKSALMLCSGLSAAQLDDELLLLENEYALIGFDEHAGCFDFMEDSRGAHEYKIKKKRIAAQWKSDFRAMFKTAKVLELAEVSNPQETAFGINHKILTNEWKFNQEILMAEDLTEELATDWIKIWKDGRSASLPKGRLIWTYIGKDTGFEVVERLQSISVMLENTPIIIMLLNDTEERLANALTNYDLLNRMNESIRQTYSRAYIDDLNQAEGILENEFEALKKQRQLMTPSGVIHIKKRLQVELTNIFESVYPQAISFNFDGLLTASNNFTGKGSTYFCQIIKMLLSNNINYDTIHDFTSDIRNRITAVLMETSATSWKCISKNYAIMPPAELKARGVYEDAVDTLLSDKFYDCKVFFDTYCYPPYGLSEEAAIMMLGVILANHSCCVRMQYDDIQTSIISWKDAVIVKDKKINLNLIKSSRMILIDSDAIEAHFQQLFNRLDATNDINDTIKIYYDIKKYAEDNGVPEDMEVNYKLACIKADSASKVQKKWSAYISKIEDEIEQIGDRRNVYNALRVLDTIDEVPIESIFNDNGFSISEYHKKVLADYDKTARLFINEYFEEWLNESIRCKSVEAMTQFDKHVKRCSEKFKKHGYTKYAQAVISKGDIELSKKDEIRRRQELLSDGKKYIRSCKEISLDNYTDVVDMLNKADNLYERLKLYEKSLGKEAKNLHAEIDEYVVLLTRAKQHIQGDMERIWEDLAVAQTIDDIETILADISKVMNYSIPMRDRDDFIELKGILSTFNEDVIELKKATRDRERLLDIIKTLRETYSGSEMDFDVNTVLENTINDVEDEIDKREQEWKAKYLTLGDRSREAAHTLKENTRVVPLYLSNDTHDLIREMNDDADQILSNAMIEDVIFYFKKLNEDERKKCIKLLLQQADI